MYDSITRRYRELPKTDNTYSPTSKFYGCTLAPGIPLIPNLCRRPLRSPGSGEYDYTFTSFSKTFSEENNSNHVNSWVEKNNFHNNGTSKSHLDASRLARRKVNYDSILDSDSDLEDSQYQYSANTVTWLSWIITTVTTIVTVISETVLGHREAHENHINTRVPLKQNAGVSWYQYPVLWLYKLALLVHRADVWLLYKVNSALRVDSWGTPQQRRKWALILLLIPPLLWAGYKTWEWLTDPSSEPLYTGVSLWDSLAAAWAWFDGTWLWAPWTALTGWMGDTTVTDQVLLDEAATEDTSSVDWSAVVSWPVNSLAALFTSTGELLGSALSTLGEGAVTVYAILISWLFAAFAWIVDCVTSVPTLLSSALALAVYPFKSMSWESAPVEYSFSAPASPSAYSTPASSASPDSPSLEHL